MGFAITVTTSGGERLVREMGIRMDKVKNLMPAWDRTEKLIYAFQKKLFLNKGASEGLSAWKELADSTKKAKKRDGFGRWADYPLIRTGRLMDAATKDAITKTPLMLVYQVNPADVPYAGYHQYGRGVPKREIIRYEIFKGRNSLTKRIETIIRDHLVKTGQFERETIF